MDVSSRPFLGAYWRPRANTAGEIARTAAEFYRDIQPLHSMLQEMAVVTKALQRLPLTGDPNEDMAAFLAGMNDTERVYFDNSGQRIPFGIEARNPTGFGVSCYPLSEEGVNAKSLDFMINAGCNAPDVGNAVTLTLPSSMLSDEPVKRLLHVMVRHWLPDFAALTKFEFLEAVEDSEYGDHVGWLNYFSDFSGAPPLDVYAIEREGSGAYLQLVETPGADFELEVRRAIKVRKQLSAAGVLKRG